MAEQTMVERVARALHAAHKPHCDYTYPFEHEMSGRAIYEGLARAAIEAMRKPTEAMIESRPFTWSIGPEEFQKIWHAGIDAALSRP